MKFIYIDESGGPDIGDTFVMGGLMVDAYRLRRLTQSLDGALLSILPTVARTRHTRTELKTSKFLNGRGKWGNVPAEVRKAFVKDLCDLSIDGGGHIFALALSYDRFRNAVSLNPGQPFGQNNWLVAAMFVASLVQKKMQRVPKSKGLTVMIMDDNKQYMPRLSDSIHDGLPWFDGLYKTQQKRRGRTTWKARTSADRFDQVVNTAFAIKSNHSSLIQVADALCYIYRRHLELMDMDEAWLGEQSYISSLVQIVEPNRAKLGRCPDEACVKFFRDARHPKWTL